MENNNKDVSLSIIIPTYNRADKISRAIMSILLQEYKDYELIIVDDCSTDDTEKVVKNFEDERIFYYKLERNLGAAGARNYGVNKSRGKYIAFHDSDDEWLPGKLTKQMSYMKEHPNYCMVYSKMHIMRKDIEGDFPNDSIDGELEGDIFSSLLIRNTIGAPTMLLKKGCFNELGGFDERLRCLEDWEFAVRFAERYRIGYIPEALICVHSEDGGVSSNIGAYYETRCKMIAKYREKLIDLGIFNIVVMDVFRRAEESGILPLVKQMLMQEMKEYMG